MGIITRAEWGARYTNGGGSALLPAKEVWLHHSVTIAPDVVAPFDDDYAAIRSLEAIGQSRFSQGISYTWLVTPAGLVFEGHSVNRRGAHTSGHNTTGRAICLVGDYTDTNPTPAQMDTVVWLLREAAARNQIIAPKITGGHRDLKATECPGNRAYAAIGELNRRAAGHVTVPVPGPAPSPDTLPVFRFGDRGPGVQHLQEFMRNVFPSYCKFPATGYYGEQTQAGVKDFQFRAKVVGNPLDGSVCGPATNAALARYGYR